MKPSRISKFYGTGLFFLLAMLFVLLKLSHAIGWWWIWVLAPLWMPVAFAGGVVVVVVLICSSALRAKEEKE